MSNLNNYEGTFVIDPTHSEIGFTARHAMVTKVRGSFTEFSGTASSEENLNNAQVNVEIDVNSADTRNADRDGHLKTGDFFEVEKFPKITFTSTEVTAKDDETLVVTGDLTIKDVTRQVELAAEYEGTAQDPFGNVRAGFTARTDVDREDFGLTWNAALETGGVLVSKKITLTLDISAIKQA